MTDCKKIFVFNGQRLFKKKHIHARLRGDIEQVDNTPFTTTLCYIGPAKNKPVRHQLEDTNHQNNKDCKCQSSSTYYGEIKDKSGNNIVYTDRWHTDTKFWRSSYCITYDFDTLEKDGCVTLRDRNTGNQERVKIEELKDKLKSLLQ